MQKGWVEIPQEKRDLFVLLFCYIVHFRECLKFCFGIVIQKELDQVTRTHNSYRIRPQCNVETPSGKPDILYSVPEITGIHCFLCCGVVAEASFKISFYCSLREKAERSAGNVVEMI